MRADTIFSRRPMPGPFHLTPGQISTRQTRTRPWATTLPKFDMRARFSPEVKTFKTQSAFIAPVKIQALSLLTPDRGSLNSLPNLPILAFQALRSPIRLETPFRKRHAPSLLWTLQPRT